jgi:hypothetical protein
MKSSVLYLCLTCAVIFFAIRVFATPTDSFYDQIVTLYGNAHKIADISQVYGVWTGNCYPRVADSTVRTNVQPVEAFMTHFHWAPPPGSPLQPIDADKFQIRPLGTDTTADWNQFLSVAGDLGTLEGYAEEHISPNTWGNLFNQPELQTATEADIRTDDQGYIYVWLRATNDEHWACYVTFSSLP